MDFMQIAIIVCVTAVITVYVPKLWSKKHPIITAGTVQEGFEPVAKLFRENFENGVEYSKGGSAYSVYYKGSKVVDIWGGYADSEALRPWEQDTITIVFSATKGMASLCMAVLVDRGLLDYEKTVASYWPEFAQNGKENITVRMLLNHEAGLSSTSEPITNDLLADQDALGEVLARSPPKWEPGTAHGYHGLTFGLYVSQLLRRADPKHRTLGQFFKEEIAQPFGIDFHIGLPLELYHRAARLTGDIGNLWLTFLKGLSSPLNRQLIWALLTTKCDLPKASDGLKLENFLRPEIIALEQPSVIGFGPARDMAEVYGILANGGATKKGQRPHGTVPRLPWIIRPLHVDWIPNLTDVGVKLFGHAGSGGMQAYADPQHKVGFAYISSYHSPYGLGDDSRFVSLREATYKCVQELEAK